MNGLYTISNPNTAATNEFNSDYNSFSDVEYFEVSSHILHTRKSRTNIGNFPKISKIIEPLCPHS